MQQKLNPVPHLRSILELASLYPREALVQAFSLAHHYNTFSHHFLRGLLEKEAPLEVAAPEPKVTTLWAVPAIRVSADLSLYQKLAEVRR